MKCHFVNGPINGSYQEVDDDVDEIIVKDQLYLRMQPTIFNWVGKA